MTRVNLNAAAVTQGWNSNQNKSTESWHGEENSSIVPAETQNWDLLIVSMVLFYHWAIPTFTGTVWLPVHLWWESNRTVGYELILWEMSTKTVYCCFFQASKSRRRAGSPLMWLTWRKMRMTKSWSLTWRKGTSKQTSWLSSTSTLPVWRSVSFCKNNSSIYIYDSVPKGVHENRTKGVENKVDDTLKLVVFLECAQC